MAITRATALIEWASQFKTIQSSEDLPFDAGLRRYVRLHTPSGTCVAVDAPPATENTQAFVEQARYLTGHGLPAPEIYQYDAERGFLLIEDLGDHSLHKIINEENCDAYYAQALHWLTQLQTLTPNPLGKYLALDEELIEKEIGGFSEWLVKKMLHTSFDSQGALTELLTREVMGQPQVFIHRDYQARNLMVKPDGSLGIIDFQDAMRGPITYDVASLLWESYIRWPDDKVTEWLRTFQEQNPLLADVDFTTVQRWFDMMGIERHLQASFAFSRKFVRDNDDRYLEAIATALSYITGACQRHEDLFEFIEFFQKTKAAVDTLIAEHFSTSTPRI